MKRNVISVLDGAAGSCGKAKVIGEIATDKTINLGASVTNCMPNAGHTFVSSRGKKTIFRNIPVSIINPHTELFIGPGSAIDMEIFKQEYKIVKPYLNNRKIYVHEMVPLIEERHRVFERENIKSGSTYKGCGAVSKEKMMRDPNLKFFSNYQDAVVCSNDAWLNLLHKHVDRSDEYIMLEGSQGCDLSLNFSGNYPYVTSRNVSTTQLLSDSGLPAESLLCTIMVIRPFPIRISNVTSSGEFVYTGAYGSGEELTWSQINVASMLGTYPFKGDLEFYATDAYDNKEYILELLLNSDKLYLKQLFGDKASYYLNHPEEVSFIQACELERLLHKGEGSYQSQLLDLPAVDAFYEDKGEQYIRDLSEQTTVTQKERRVFDLDINKLKNNCMVNNPYSLYLNFFQHLDCDFHHYKGSFDKIHFDKYIKEYLRWLEYETNCELASLGTGAKNNERIIKKSLIMR
ncbi:MAG: adenylosuccinate synthetase [Bacilli bacterium]|nr:adenylosuccinate synthetase [Bacilli bacterium]